MRSFLNWMRYAISIKTLAIIAVLVVFAFLIFNSRAVFQYHFKGVEKYSQNLSQYLKYQYRELSFEKDGLITKPVSRSWVNIEGFTNDGHIAIRIYDENGGISTVTAELADLNVTNKHAAAVLVKNYFRQQAEVDYYEYEKDGELHRCVVVWLPDGRPLNLLLIEEGLATPTIKPPTNIVNKLMVAYYKGLL